MLRRWNQNDFPNKTHNSQLIPALLASFDFGDQGLFVTALMKKKTPSSFTTNTTKQATPCEDAQHACPGTRIKVSSACSPSAPTQRWKTPS